MILNTLFLLIQFSLFFAALTIHEFSHAWVAYKKGDPTAKFSGRLTLNPLAHIDILGTFLLPLFLILSGSRVIFGWAKPVPINYWLLRSPKKDMVWVGLAGPLANFVAAFIAGLLAKMFPLELLRLFVFLNLILCFFNLIPIPPLDGSRILAGLLPPELSLKYARLEPYGFLIIIALLFLGLISNIIFPLAEFFYRIFL